MLFFGGDVAEALPDGSNFKGLNAIDGLKQSALEWHKVLHDATLNDGSAASTMNACLLIRGQMNHCLHYVHLRHLFAGDYEEEVQGVVNHLLERYDGRDLDVPDKPIGVALMVADEGTKLDQPPYTKRIVVEVINSFDVSRFPHHSRAKTEQLKFSLRDNFGEAHAPDKNHETRYILKHSTA